MKYETDSDSRKSKRPQNQDRQKFVSDDDIVGRDKVRRPQIRPSGNTDDAEPKFVSDEDIVRRQVA